VDRGRHPAVMREARSMTAHRASLYGSEPDRGVHPPTRCAIDAA
jgi:hypothetical protein